MVLKVQLHLHTTESTGTRVNVESLTKPKEAIDVAKKIGIDAIAITDHNVTSAFPKIEDYAKKNNIVLIRGVEIDTNNGHIIGLGVDLDIEKKIKKFMTLNEACDLIKNLGGDIYIPHPFDIRFKGVGTKIKEIDGIIEVFNPLNIFGFEDMFADFAASKLKRPKVIGADAHMPWMIPLCITVVDSEPEEHKILKAIKNGKISFKNCRHLTLKEMKELSLARVLASHDYIKNEIKDGWKIDMTYMLLANSRLIKPFENFALDLGMRKKNSRIWDVLIYFSYFLARLYSIRAEREFNNFIKNL
jgi:predicted metal-dependent phosphoesterase TrpH